MVSVLAMNIDETKLIKIGASMDRSLIWEGQYGLDWANAVTALRIF